MQYITGTRFTVKDPKALRKLGEKFTTTLKPGIYSLLSIRKKDSKLLYSFSCGSNRIEIGFDSCSEADSFISSCLKN